MTLTHGCAKKDTRALGSGRAQRSTHAAQAEHVHWGSCPSSRETCARMLNKTKPLQRVVGFVPSSCPSRVCERYVNSPAEVLTYAGLSSAALGSWGCQLPHSTSAECERKHLDPRVCVLVLAD
ncbi:hypothetical protein PanWU01x14_018120 [Parasponia andersonii]|uniref:Uncharacterized protein n=1 Tax=Parasponia andersonii TaxID=3476 RepID=A0A2P5DZ34_PARAD|nr:hypothetical protein PanWU01x14_018120 [Parasponia andersonii]